MILVCVTYYRATEYVERSIRSILSQTHRDIAVVVIGDGEEPPLKVRDSRLELYTLPENRGPYFAQSVALAASPFFQYAPVGADDWLDEDHLETLLEVGGSAVVPSSVWWEQDGETRIHHGLYEVGLFATERLRSIGGYNPSERIGQDTLMMRILRETGGYAESTETTYHRVRRGGSLTTSPETGHGSPLREAMKARNRAVFRRIRRLPTHAAIRGYRESIVPTWIRDEVAEHAERLSQKLGRRVAA